MDRIAVVGWAQTGHRTAVPELSSAEMIFETVSRALEHAGGGIDAVDMVIGAGDDCLDGRSISSVFVVEHAGAFLKEESKVEEDGAFAAAYAWMRIAGGGGDTALVYGYGKPSESAPGSYSALIADPFYLRPLGMDARLAAALSADAYARARGLAPEVSAEIAARNLASAAANPNASRRISPSAREVLSAPRAIGGLSDLELPATADGCCAILLARESALSRFKRRTPSWIRGLGWATDGPYLGHRDLTKLESAGIAAIKAYQMAGIGDPTGAFDLAELSPASSVHELLLADALGLARGGKTVLNPSGGTLGADPIMATGLVRLAEAASQLAGEAGPIQVPGARRAVVHGACGLAMQSNIVFCLEGGA